MGTYRVYLDGGEPLLRPDIRDIVAAVSELNCELTLVTKSVVDRSKAVALKAAGLKAIDYSLDTGDPETAERLVGVKGFFRQAVTSISALVSAGVDVTILSVLTRSTVTQVEGLDRLAAKLGCKEIVFSPLGIAPWGRASKSEVPSRKDLALFREWVDAGDHAVPVRMLEDRRRPEPFLNDRSGCASGISSMVITPRGDVTLCDKLPFPVVGNIIEQDPADVWYSTTLEAVRFPERAAFVGTECFDCNEFEACNRRGRCLASCLSARGRLYGPCQFCRKGLGGQ